MIQLSLQAARTLALAAQGLLEPPPQPATKAAALDAIRRMGALQIDTINVVARSPYLVLWSRLGDYNPAWLDELLAEGALFEYWSHAACFLPREDFPLHRRLLHEGVSGWRDPRAWLAEHAALAEQILRRIREEGPLKSSDFESEPPAVKRSGWWDWKEEKQALQHLWTAGKLMVARREAFQRVFDLTARVRPDWSDPRSSNNEGTRAGSDLPELAEVYRRLASKAVKAMGVALPKWAPDYFRTPRNETLRALAELEQSGDILPVEVEGLASIHSTNNGRGLIGPAYVHRENAALAERAAMGELVPTLTTILSPFDPLIWDRARTRQLFGFDFAIESYLPPAKRKYGYFTLPLLVRGAFVGRMDAKAHREEGLFEVRGLFLEPGVEPTPALGQEITEAIQWLARWHGMEKVAVVPEEAKKLLAISG